VLRKVTCPNPHENTKLPKATQGMGKILFVYEEKTKPSGTFLVFCGICKMWYEIRFNNSSPIIVRMPKGYNFKFVTTPSLVHL